MSSSDPAVCISSLGKSYQLYDSPRDRLKQFVVPRLQRIVGRTPKQYFRDFWALKDITFEVKKGEAVGIIGRNGAGKSTLLQLICGTLSPTTGSVVVNGTVAALLELGSGFNPDFTGRENVYTNASVLGLSRDETDNKFDEIAAFADIGDVLDQPTKHYSSGMLMRLAFAVNACVDPEILIVDEALGVGDAPFQSKCFKRLRQLIDDGTSILFVSHDISTVRSICRNALWLKNGRTESWGNAMEVAKEYEKFCWREQGVVMLPQKDGTGTMARNPSLPPRSADVSADVPVALFAPNPSFEANRTRSREGTGAVAIRNFLMLNQEGLAVSSCEYGETLSLHYLLEVSEPVNSDFIIGFRVRDTRGTFVYSANDLRTIHRIEANAGDRYVVSTNIKIPLAHQNYVVLTGIFGFSEGLAFTNGIYDFSKSVIWDVIEDAAYLTVRPCKLMPLAGPVNASFDLKIRRLN